MRHAHACALDESVQVSGAEWGCAPPVSGVLLPLESDRR